jgi:heat shock protein HslJ
VLIGVLALSALLRADEPPAGWQLRCSGNEPFWRFEASGTTGKLIRPAEQGADERTFEGAMSRVDYLRPPWLVWRGVETKEPIAVLVAAVREESCQDSMSGASFDHLVVLSLAAEEPLTGCCKAVRLQDGEAESSEHATPRDILYDGRWLLEEMEGLRVSEAPRLFLTFTSDGKVTGNAGCNQFSGEAKVAGNSLRLGPLISTRRACVDQARMDREQRFLDAVERTRSWRIDQGHLVLLNTEGAELLRLARQE